MILAVYQPCMESISRYGGGQSLRDVISEKNYLESKLGYIAEVIFAYSLKQRPHNRSLWNTRSIPKAVENFLQFESNTVWFFFVK